MRVKVLHWKIEVARYTHVLFRHLCSYTQNMKYSFMNYTSIVEIENSMIIG